MLVPRVSNGVIYNTNHFKGSKAEIISGVIRVDGKKSPAPKYPTLKVCLSKMVNSDFFKGFKTLFAS